MGNIKKKNNIFRSIETHIKKLLHRKHGKALYFGGSRYLFRAIFVFSGLPGMNTRKSYVRALGLSQDAQILRIDIARVFCNTAICWRQLYLMRQCRIILMILKPKLFCSDWLSTITTSFPDHHKNSVLEIFCPILHLDWDQYTNCVEIFLIIMII